MCGECYEPCHEKTSFLQYMQWGRSAMVQADQGLLLFVALILSVVTCLFQIQQANSENLCPPPRFFLRNKESSEKVKFIRGVTLTRYILFTYVDSYNA